MVSGGAVIDLHVWPPSDVRARARQEPDEQGTVPATHPSELDTKVTDAGAKPAATGAPGGVVVAGGTVVTARRTVGNVATVLGEGAMVGATVGAGATVESVEEGAPAVVEGPGDTTPMWEEPPLGQSTIAKPIPAAATATAAAAVSARGQRSRLFGDVESAE
jgi:hypothetical protein